MAESLDIAASHTKTWAARSILHSISPEKYYIWPMPGSVGEFHDLAELGKTYEARCFGCALSFLPAWEYDVLLNGRWVGGDCHSPCFPTSGCVWKRGILSWQSWFENYVEPWKCGVPLNVQTNTLVEKGYMYMYMYNVYVYVYVYIYICVCVDRCICIFLCVCGCICICI